MFRIPVRLLVLAAVILSLFAPVGGPVSANPVEINGPTPIVVETTALVNDPNDGLCDLWEALKATFDLHSSNDGTYHECTATPGPNVITFSPAIAGQTITLPAADPYPELPYINDDVTIMGPIVLDGGGQAADLHVFHIAHSGRLTLINLTVTNAFTSGSGGAVLDNGGGELNLIGVSMVGNTAESNGGAIDSIGDVNIIGSNFSGNRALGTRDSAVNDNPGVGFGGAISVGSYATLTIAGSTFNANTADKGGGAIYFTGQQAELVDTTFNANVMNDLIPTDNPESNLRGGGAILVDPDAIVNITRVAFDANVSLSGRGGAMYTAIDSEVSIADTSFNANIAGNPGDQQMGGGIYNPGGILDIRRSAFLFNLATGNGGGLANDRTGEATLANVTFFRNDADTAGGAIWNGQTQTGGPGTYLWGYNLTIADNDTPGGTVYNQEDGSHEVSFGNVIIRHSADPNANCVGPITSLGHNIESGASCAFSGTGDISSTDPQLQALNFNGGALTSLLSMKLNTASPAAGGGDSAICQNEFVNSEDQRGEERPQSGGGGNGCDRGAVENDTLKPGYGSTPVQPGPLDFGSVQVGNSYTLAFEIFETGNDTLSVNTASLSGANANQFNIVTATPFSITDGDSSNLFEVTCAPTGGAGVRSATLTLTTNDTDNLSVDYTLTCNATVAPVAGYASEPIEPGPIDFGQVVLGSSGIRYIFVTNTGNALLTISNPQETGSNPDDFQVVTGMPFAIAGGVSDSIALECTPQEIGIRTATITFTTNDPAHTSVSYNLVCEGIAPPSPVIAPPGVSLSAFSMDAPYGIAISPDGRHIYAGADSADAVIGFRRDPATGEVAWFLTQGDPDGDLDGARMVLVSPDGENVYVAAFYGDGTNTGDAITVFSRDSSTGDLNKIDSVANGDSYGCIPLPCNGTIDALDGAYGMAISPNGEFFYASGVNSDGLVVLRRGEDGSLSSLLGGANFVQSYINSTELNGAYGIALSPDGANLYATGYSSDTLVTFNIDPVTGELTYVNTLSAPAIAGLNGVFRVIVSKDGRFVYTASYDSDSVTAFQRDMTDGTLTYLFTYTNGVGDVVGLDAATSVVLSPDQRYLFATAYTSDSVTVFERDLQTGLLNFVQSVPRDGGSGLPALDGARDVVVSPEGNQVFATGYLDDRMVIFDKANPIATLTGLSPASAQQGGPAFTLSVTGENFVPESVVRWNGADLATTYINPQRLDASVPASGLSSSGTANITIYNPEPGGGISANALLFTISAPGDNPVPVAMALLPGGAAAGGPAFTLTVQGSDFVSGATIQWNGNDLATTYVSSTELQANIAASAIAQPGMASVHVTNPSPGGGQSNALIFEIAGPGENPAPGVSSITPAWAFGRGLSGSGQVLTVTGLNFLPESTVYWNGTPRPTTYVSATELQAALSPADLAFPTIANVSVVSPGPGGGESNVVSFMVIEWYGLFIPQITK